jgi:lipopolysaccharide/colanic/teichoic acid biosynthesis glycosyltransferase
VPDRLQRLCGAFLAAVTLPLVGLFGVLVRLDTPGPAIYRAMRVGRNGQIFTCYKLRTMHRSTEDRTSAISVADDPRVTRLGRTLRKVRLDELPQFWNVARGEMRLVGPRPEDPRFVDLHDPLHRAVLRARPGITGLTQVIYLREAVLLAGGEPDRTYRERILPEKLEIDARYLANRSAALDLWILWATFRALSGHLPTPQDIDRWAPARGRPAEA